MLTHTQAAGWSQEIDPLKVAATGGVKVVIAAVRVATERAMDKSGSKARRASDEDDINQCCRTLQSLVRPKGSVSWAAAIIAGAPGVLKRAHPFLVPRVQASEFRELEELMLTPAEFSAHRARQRAASQAMVAMEHARIQAMELEAAVENAMDRASGPPAKGTRKHRLTHMSGSHAMSSRHSWSVHHKDDSVEPELVSHARVGNLKHVRKLLTGLGQCELAEARHWTEEEEKWGRYSRSWEWYGDTALAAAARFGKAAVVRALLDQVASAPFACAVQSSLPLLVGLWVFLCLLHRLEAGLRCVLAGTGCCRVARSSGRPNPATKSFRVWWS